MTTIPESATAYIARLVDSRKKAYASDCLACWQQGQPFATEWPNLKAEYVQDVAAKMRRYLKAPKPVAATPEPSPVVAWVETVTEPNPQPAAKPVRKPRTVTSKATEPSPLYSSPSRYTHPDEIAMATYLSERVVRVCESCIPTATRPRLIKGARGQKATRFVPFGAYDSEYSAEEKQSHRCIRCGSLDGSRGCYVTQADIDAAISIAKEIGKSESFAEAAG